MTDRSPQLRRKPGAEPMTDPMLPGWVPTQSGRWNRWFVYTSEVAGPAYLVVLHLHAHIRRTAGSWEWIVGMSFTSPDVKGEDSNTGAVSRLRRVVSAVGKSPVIRDVVTALEALADLVPEPDVLWTYFLIGRPRVPTRDFLRLLRIGIGVSDKLRLVSCGNPYIESGWFWTPYMKRLCTE